MSKVAAGIMQALTEISTARPSATVILARETAFAPELFMVRRHVRSSFGAAYVFPGGVVDRADGDVYDYCTGRDAAGADKILGLTVGGLDFFVAAIRELFEETGVLLATHANTVRELETVRNGLNRNSQSWSEFLRNSNVRLLCDQLHYFSHWITPDSLPKRYTTRFFLSELPAGQIAHHDERELTDSKWITAADALTEGKAGSMMLHYPTRMTLDALAGHKSVGALVNWAHECEITGVEAIHPVMPGVTR